MSILKNQMALSCILLSLTTTALGGEVDKLFQQADLKKLIGSNKVLNLMAQTSNPEASTNMIDTLDDFVAIGNTPLNQTVIAEFDKTQKILQQRTVDSPWVGVRAYSQKELRHLSLQKGLASLKACMRKQGVILPDNISRVTVYKALVNGNIIYDYTFKFHSNSCQEMLYVPTTDECQPGMKVNCHYDIADYFMPISQWRK